MAAGQGLRTDLDGSGQLTLMALAAGLWAVGVGGVVASLRPYGEPPVSRIVVPVLAGLALLAVAFPWPGMALMPVAFWPWTTICLLTGALATGAASMGILLLDRDDVPTTQRTLLVAGGVALAMFAFQNLHCRFNDPAHLFVGHALYVVLIGPLLLWVNRLRRG